MKPAAKNAQLSAGRPASQARKRSTVRLKSPLPVLRSRIPRSSLSCLQVIFHSLYRGTAVAPHPLVGPPHL